MPRPSRLSSSTERADPDPVYPWQRVSGASCGTGLSSAPPTQRSPFLLVPVLSSASARSCPRFSRWAPPLMSTPFRADLRDAGQHCGRRAEREGTGRSGHQQRHPAIETQGPIPYPQEWQYQDQQQVGDKHRRNEHALEALGEALSGQATRDSGSLRSFALRPLTRANRRALIVTASDPPMSPTRTARPRMTKPPMAAPARMSLRPSASADLEPNHSSDPPKSRYATE